MLENSYSYGRGTIETNGLSRLFYKDIIGLRFKKLLLENVNLVELEDGIILFSCLLTNDLIKEGFILNDLPNMLVKGLVHTYKINCFVSSVSSSLSLEKIKYFIRISQHEFKNALYNEIKKDLKVFINTLLTAKLTDQTAILCIDEKNCPDLALFINTFGYTNLSIKANRNLCYGDNETYSITVTQECLNQIMCFLKNECKINLLEYQTYLPRPLII